MENCKIKVRLNTYEEVKKKLPSQNQIGISDYARANYGIVSSYPKLPNGQASTMWYLSTYCKYASYECESDRGWVMDSSGRPTYTFPDHKEIGIVPVLEVELPAEFNKKDLLWQEVSLGTETYKDEYGKKHTQHLIAFKNLVAPNTRVSDKQLIEKINAAIADAEPCLTFKGCTEKIGRFDSQVAFRQAQAYVYGGKLYTVMQAESHNSRHLYNDTYKDGETIRDWDMEIFEVEPIVFTIESPWESLPTFLNPKGTGEAKTITLRAKEVVLAGVPFSTNGTWDYKNEKCQVKKYLDGFVDEHLIDMDAVLGREKLSDITTFTDEEREG